jgi:voltage-gated potassium channel
MPPTPAAPAADRDRRGPARPAARAGRPAPPPQRVRAVLCRASVGAARRDDDGFEMWLEDVLVRTEPFFAWLGVVFALVVAAQLALAAKSQARPALNYTVTALWAVFAVDYAVKLLVAPHKLHFLRTHWVQLLGLVAPALRFLSFVRLARLGRMLPAARVVSASYRSVGTAGQLLRNRVAYLAGLGSIAVVMVGELEYVVDGGPHTPLGSLVDALLWAAATVIGQSPTLTPRSHGGQLVMLLGMLVGLVVIATLAGTLGSFLLDARAERATAEDAASGSADPR